MFTQKTLKFLSQMALGEKCLHGVFLCGILTFPDNGDHTRLYFPGSFCKERNEFHSQYVLPF